MPVHTTFGLGARGFLFFDRAVAVQVGGPVASLPIFPERAALPPPPPIWQTSGNIPSHMPPPPPPRTRILN